MKIDSHVHFWKFNSTDYFWVEENIRKDCTPQDLQSVLRGNAFDGCIAVQARQSEEETLQLLKWGESFSFIKGVVGWVDLCSTKVEERLAFFGSNTLLKGIRHTVWDKSGEFLTDPAFINGIKGLGRFGMRYDILVFDYQLPAVVELVKKFPNQLFVLNHMGNPSFSKGNLEEWCRNIRALGEFENVYCKISGLVNRVEEQKWQAVDFAPGLDVVVNAFGIDRLMFGSDWPVCLSRADYEEVLQLVLDYFKGFSEVERSQLFGENAGKFYGVLE